MRSVALFDFDNTLYDGFSYFSLLEKQVHEKLVGRETLTQASAIMQTYKDGHEDYEKTVVYLLDAYAEGLKGKPYEAIYSSTLQYYQRSEKVYPFVKPVFTLLRQKNHDICLVTGEPQFAAEAIKKIYGLDDYYATQFEEQDGIFTGKVSSYLASRHEKHEAIRHLLEGHNLENSFAFGDSEGDIEMLAAVKHAVCINATQGLRERANDHGWPCVSPEDVSLTVSAMLAK